MITPTASRRRILQAGGAALACLALPARTRAADVPSRDGFAAVPGGRVYWRQFGAGGNTPLLTLHGGPGAAHNYLLTMSALADERPVIFYDQLGCGRADSPGDERLYTLQRSVDELDAVRDALGLDRVALFGHSWGGILAIEYACQGRDVGVEKLVLSGTAASIPQIVAGMQRLISALPNGYAAKLRELERAGLTHTDEYASLVQIFFEKHLLRAPPSAEVTASTASLSHSIAYRVMNGPNEFTIIGNLKDWERRGDLKRIRQKTLVTTGEFDEITRDCSETLRDGIAGQTEIVVVPGCSHLTMAEQPEAYNAIVRRFLSGD